METGIFNQQKAAHRHTSYLKKKLEQTLSECKMISYLQDCKLLPTRKFQINFHQTKDTENLFIMHSVILVLSIVSSENKLKFFIPNLLM